MRMDRVMDFNRPFSLKVVCSILNTMNYRYVMILEPHSERTKGLLGTRCYPQKFNFESHLDVQSNIVFPDAGAYQRYKILSNNWGHIVFNKVRDLETLRSFPLEERLIVRLLLMICVMLEEHSLESLKFLKRDIQTLNSRL